MKSRKILIGITAASFLMMASMFINSKISAEDQGLDQGAIMAKLDQVLNNQKVIMDQISSMKQELNIVKIRITQTQ